MLLTCCEGVSRSCALHKLRWKVMPEEVKVMSKGLEVSSKPPGTVVSTEDLLQSTPSSPARRVGHHRLTRSLEDTDAEALLMSLEPSGELKKGGESVVFDAEGARLKRVKSDESDHTARSKGEELPSVGIDGYDSMVVASGPRRTNNASTEKQLGKQAPSGGGMLLMRRNSSSTSSTGEAGGGWGFYEDCDSFFSRESTSRLDVAQDIDRVTPEYVLEDTLASQALWHSTAGKRPPQPLAERKKYEALWAKNFEESQVDYSRATDPRPPRPSAETPHVVPLLREQSPFGTSATKSWECPCCGELSSMMVHIPKYQVVKEGSFDIHAEYLVVVRLRFVTFGLWRRYSHFQRLADKIVRENRPLDFENTLGSWRCVKRRQKWFRCLDKDYITLKCFLLERFLHDAVFESTTSELFLDFLEIQIPNDASAD
ncbi:hypothetical protein CTAYLR_006719 [Chrysophaeum taylorii]|uniref:PX domain-containing protein n=1 Tax=Chrysophaeum taylorii TaxID=2483200 RepID=A0AAD7XHC9_9STRA|nr:hypothetical protein CTAYLR_006719 [Chrysophaeum taylorii]